jgi:hypothetical protein
MSTSSTSYVHRRHLSLVVVALLALGATACGTSADRAEKPGTSTPTSTAAVPSAKQLWVATDSAEATGKPRGASVVRISPDGKVVVVAGGGPTVAYDAASGARLWQASEDGMGNGAAWLAVSPDGSAVYVTGTVAPESPDAAYRTVAYGLANGKRLWAATFKEGTAQHDVASVVATDALVVIDGTASEGSGEAVTTVAYDARTGARKWVTRLGAADGGALGWFPNGARSLAVDAAGTADYLTTASPAGTGSAIVTVAYDAATGGRRWLARHRPAGTGTAMGAAVAVSPDGKTLVMTGMAESAKTRTDSVTVAYDTASGKQRWAKSYNGPANQNEGTGLLAFQPDGATVFAAGTSEGATVGHEDMLVLAYDTATGDQRWVKRWDGPAKGDDNAADLAVAPDTSSLVVVGRTVPQPMKDQYATAALLPATGAVLWSNTYGITTSGDGNLACEAKSVVIGPDGTVFVTGAAAAGSATLAYAPPE